MPVSANKLVSDFRRKLRAVNSGQSNEYKTVDTIGFLNDAYRYVIAEIIENDQDQNETVRNHLRLLKKKVCLSCKSVDSRVCSVDIPVDLYYGLDLVAETSCKDCAGITKHINIVKPQSDDLPNARKNPYRTASFEYEQLLGTEIGELYHIFHEGKLDVKEVCMYYYKKLIDIQAPEMVDCEDGYSDYDGVQVKVNVDFEISNTYLADKVVDVAVAFAMRASGQVNEANSKLQEIMAINQLYK